MRFDFALPRRSTVLQFGGTEVSDAFLSCDMPIRTIMPSVGERVNVTVLLLAILRGRLGRWGYYRTFVEVTRAKLVFVWHDTNIEAYQLEHHLRIPVWCFQNGHRLKISPHSAIGLIEALEKSSVSFTPRVSKYFAFGPSPIALLAPYIQADFEPIGSLRLNSYLSNRKIGASPKGESHRPTIGFIVSFPNSSDIPNGRIAGNESPFVRLCGATLSYSEYFQIDLLVAQALFSLSLKIGCDVAIIGKRSNRDTTEREYFASLPNRESMPVMGHEKGNGYALADEFDYLVTVDSTLGYEMLGLGKKVGFICSRFKTLGISFPDERVGHSLNWDTEGPFWTTASEIESMMVFLERFIAISEIEWTAMQQRYVSQLMRVDPGNKIIQARLREYLVGES